MQRRRAQLPFPARGLTAAAVALAAAMQVGCLGGSPPATGGAEWIWPLDSQHEHGQPASYILLRDFELALRFFEMDKTRSNFKIEQPFSKLRDALLRDFKIAS